MKKIFRMILLTATICLPAIGEESIYDGSVLLWMVNDSPTAVADFDGSTYSIGELAGRGEAAGTAVNAVRVSAVFGESNVRLRLRTTDMEGWCNMVALPDGDDEYNVGPAWADLSGLDVSSSPDISFMIELGYFNGSDWLTLAVSEFAAASELRDFIRPAQLAQYGQLEWIPSYHVPEPNTGILMLIGFCLLLSRRTGKTV